MQGGLLNSSLSVGQTSSFILTSRSKLMSMQQRPTTLWGAFIAHHISFQWSKGIESRKNDVLKTIALQIS
jgi:hypothetical protein